MKKKLLATLLVVLFFVSPISTFATKGDQGVDLSLFGMGIKQHLVMHMINYSISQIGGQNNYGIYDQVTYSSQVASTIAQGKRAHVCMVAKRPYLRKCKASIRLLFYLSFKHQRDQLSP